MLKKIREWAAGMRAGVGDWTDRSLDNTFDHYRCLYPERKKGLSAWILRSYFSDIRVDEAQTRILREIPEDAVIVYANNYKSDFEYLFFHTRFSQEGLPVPEIGFDYRFFWTQPLSRLYKIFLAHTSYLIQNFAFPNPYNSGYIREALKAGKTGFLSLVEEKGFYRRFVKERTDPLRYLLDMQHDLERPVYIVPLLIFYSKKPGRSSPGLIDILFGSQENPGRIRRFFAMTRQNPNIFVEISEPLNLRAFMDHKVYRELKSEEQSLLLRRQLLIRMNRHRQSITGPLSKPRAELKENILTNNRLRKYMETHAANRSKPIQKIRKEADRYLDEIAAKYSLGMIHVFSLAVRTLVNLMFDGISVNSDALNRIRNLSRRGPLVFVPCHKSHIDYLIISYILFHNDYPCPLIAAGKNLSFWPLGPIFRRGGAFFIRRTFKGAVLYSKVFTEYVHKILEEGFNVEFFIEGGRSRTGKLLQPKLGLLSILLKAFQGGASDDLIFVPVFIGYDRVPEEGAYLRELEGGEKRPEDLKQVIKARKFLKKRYGRIYIRFHEGISMNDLAASGHTPIPKMTSKELNGFCRDLGHRLIHAIDRISVITPHAIVAAALLNGSKNWFTRERLMADIETYMNFLSSLDVKLADTLLVDPAAAFDYVFESYRHRKFVEQAPSDRDREKAERKIGVNPGKRAALGYYKNNCINAFIPAAFTAMSILDQDAFQFYLADLYPSYERYQELFSLEFSHDMDRPPADYVNETVRSFVNDAILMPHPTLTDRYNLTSAGFRKLKLFARFLCPYLQSYWIALQFFSATSREADSGDRLKKMHSLGNRMFKNGEIELPETLSQINYKNAIDYYLSHGIRGSEDAEAIASHQDLIRRALDILQR